MPGKEVVVAHRLSMDRSATAGAPLPPADDYVFQKAGAAVDRARPRRPLRACRRTCPWGMRMRLCAPFCASRAPGREGGQQRQRSGHGSC